MLLRLAFASRRVFQFRKFVYGHGTGSRTQPGLHGRLRVANGSCRAITWEREQIGALLDRVRPLELHYRLGRDRHGEIQAEIVAARPASCA